MKKNSERTHTIDYKDAEAAMRATPIYIATSTRLTGYKQLVYVDGIFRIITGNESLELGKFATLSEAVDKYNATLEGKKP